MDVAARRLRAEVGGHSHAVDDQTAGGAYIDLCVCASPAHGQRNAQPAQSFELSETLPLFVHANEEPQNLKCRNPATLADAFASVRQPMVFFPPACADGT
ncbi:MAG TPA: hypothetical protein VG860_18420, partial [Terriglobia bacterium]|nr:hypothetical protein [Terriglobia bacterium]